MHLHLRRALQLHHPEVAATFFDVPRQGFGRRLVSAAVPGLATLDLDLQPLRESVARSLVVRRHLAHLPEEPDALHLYTHNASLMSTGVMRRIPSVVSLDATNRQNVFNLPHRAPTRFTPRMSRAIVAMERRVYEAAHRIVTHSRWAATSVMTYGVPSSRIEVVPFGIALPPAPTREPHCTPRIVFVGTSMARKGGWRLIDVWRRTLRDRSTLTVVTPEAIAPEPGLEVHNDVHAGDGQIERILESADIFAMPSEIDQFGYGALEAMGAGLPVVASRIAAMPEIVEDGVTGILVERGNDAELAQALATLVDDGDLRDAMGDAGRQRLEDQFDAATTTAALVDILSDAARSR